MIVQIGSNGMKKNTDVVQTKQPVTNGLDKSQVLVPGEGQDGSGGEHHKYSSNLSKIRENHLAKRRDYIRQNKMPELSELSEKDSPDNNNEEKAETVIKTKDDTPSCEINGDVIMPSIPNEFLQKLGLTQDGKSSEELSDQEIESKFTSLSLAFKTDSQTLEKRLEIQERSRDIAEQNVDKELQGLRIGLETLNQICTDPQVREVLTKIQNHIDILEKSTARVSSRAEVFGAIQQEKRMSKAVDIMVHHVENIRRVHEREHAELEEARKLLQDSRSLAPSTIDLPGGEMLSRRSASVCQNSMFGGKLSPQGAPTLNPMTPSTAKAIKLLKASRRRVSEIALPKVLGGTGAATLHPSASMDSFYTEIRSPRVPGLFRAGTDSSIEEDEDARSRFQAVIASTTVKTAVANTLRRASLEKQNHVQHVTPANTPQVSRDNSSDSPNKHIDVQDKEKQKNLEEEAFKKGYEQGMRASLGQDLSSLREQQNNINESLGEIMDSIDNQIEEPKSLKELLTERFHEAVPKIKISGWRIRMTMGCFFIVMAVLSVIISLFPASSASLIDYRHYGRPPL
ncbi:inositol 1,4,5-triphosphate receptor associated 1-like isoform X2 [Ruditapes philippinarum]|uniref:inositol 1,4,5-triphosphate receptor associated 1-like isoform X2 n=1 Tax=Ruditapes philippinarum TaxID=129788 RepID=UPI00295BF059|nr:inositol 1,4,5-triphosphate receptor associated 1-like isoform X2 [Ruditapes philippinarum]